MTYLTADVLALTSGAAPVRQLCRLLPVFFPSVFSGMETQEEESCSFAAFSLPLARSATVSAPLTIIPPSHAPPPPPSLFPSSFYSSPFLYDLLPPDSLSSYSSNSGAGGTGVTKVIEAHELFNRVCLRCS